MKHTTLPLTALVLSALVLAIPLDAQRTDRASRIPRNSGFGAAQLNIADGEVLIVRANGDRFQARAGDEIFPGDRITTGVRSRAEIQLSRTNLARLGTNSELEIEGIGNRAFRLDLIEGLLHYSQLRDGNADVDIETEAASIQPIKPSVFSVEARPGGQSDITVRKGVVEVFSDRGAEKVKDGKSVTIRSDRAETVLAASKADPKTDFDDWSKRRNKMLQPPVYNRGLWTPGWGWGFGPTWGLGYGFGGGYWGGFGRRGFGRSTVIIRGGGGRRGRR
jgi:hypothetical protein